MKKILDIFENKILIVKYKYMLELIYLLYFTWMKGY